MVGSCLKLKNCVPACLINWLSDLIDLWLGTWVDSVITGEQQSSNHWILAIFLIGCHDDVMLWKLFPCYWRLVRGIHRSPRDSPHKRSVKCRFLFLLILAQPNCWTNRGVDDDLRPQNVDFNAITCLASCTPRWHDSAACHCEPAWAPPKHGSKFHIQSSFHTHETM